MGQLHHVNAPHGSVTVVVDDVRFDVDGDVVTPVVDFNVSALDAAGNLFLPDLTVADARGRLSRVRFNLAKLVPGVNGEPDEWFDYATNNRVPANLVDNGGGSYTYTFDADVAANFDPLVTHRLALQVYNLHPDILTANPIHDFVPNGDDVVLQRAIASIDSCNECHGRLAIHGGGRVDTRMCVMCHNPNHDPENPEIALDVMVHRIHSAQVFADHDFTEVTYPQQLTNCRKCHNGDDEDTPDGDNWRTRPNKAACTGCHANVVFEEPVPEGMVLHTGGAFDSNAACSGCHPAEGGLAGITDVHLTENATPNNPDLPDGLLDIAYDLVEVRVDDQNVVEIDFSVLADGELLDVLALPEALTTPGRYPTFLMAYAMVPEGEAASADYNNIGRSAAQPQSISLGGLIDDGAVVAAADAGVFTASIPDGFPLGASLRAVAFQGYFQQQVGEAAVARHAISVVQGVTGDDQRREIVDSDKCANCHEWFEGHGGNRVYQVGVCVTCHNPNLTSSGRAADPAGLPEATIAALGEDPLTFPEEGQHFKTLIHGIHGGEVRASAFEFVRNRNGGLYYDFSEVTFPNDPAQCEVCHLPDTWRPEAIPETELLTTDVVTGGADATRDDIVAARNAVPNADDLASTATAAACGSCHNRAPARAHYEQNGGLYKRPRGTSE